MSSPEDLDDEVGYKRPPKASQFKPGRSGNPGGRRKGSQNAATLLNQIAFKKVKITENGHTRYITKFEVALTQLVNKAAAGDLRALRDYLYWRKMLSENEANEELPVSDEKQQLGIAALLKRMHTHLDEVVDQNIKSETQTEEEAGKAI